MKTQKQKSRSFWAWRVKNYLKYQTLLVLLFAALFVCTRTIFAVNESIVISRVLYNPNGTDNKSGELSSYEMVELKNISSGSVDVSKWQVRISTYQTLAKITNSVPQGGKIIIYNGIGTDKNLDFSEGKEAFLYRNKTGSQLGDTKGEIALYDNTSANENTIVDYFAYGTQTSSTNFAHAEKKNLWKSSDFAVVVKEGCVMVLNEKKNFGSSDWKSECPKVGNDSIGNGLVGELELPDEVFVNVYADFAVEKLEKNAKVTWSFGDGHKSYLQSTRHKYEKEGKYLASVKYASGGEDVFESFEIEVKEISHPKLRVVVISANPKGADTGQEFLTIENKTKKKVNLKGWSIATCWKKCINHPIREDFKIKGKQSKNITNDFSSFTLNNTKAKIELRYPDGKVAHDVKYKKKKGSIDEDEIYSKTKNGWIWEAAKNHESRVMNQEGSKSVITEKEITIETQDTINIQDVTNNTQNAADSNQQESKSTEENAQKPLEENIPTKKVEIEIFKNENPSHIELLNAEPKVLGAQNVREMGGEYFLTPMAVEQEHYAVIFWKNFMGYLNEKINALRNNF